MTGRERFLTAISRGKPDRLPCLIHAWIDYHLKTHMKGMNMLQAYEYVGMDPVMYTGPVHIYNDRDRANWIVDHRDLGVDSDGNHVWQKVITTPEGTLTEKGAYNAYTEWMTEYLIKNEDDFELWNKYVLLPERLDWTPVITMKLTIGDSGIVRGAGFDFGQGSPWQSFASYLYGTEEAIMACYDKPDWIHYVLKNMLEKKLSVLERGGKIELDLIETGGGAGSSTLISPSLHKEFCLPYDKIQHKFIRENGSRSVYHLCGGVMPLLEIVAENGAEGLETMTPPSMGGDCDLGEAYRRVGDKLFFIGGFDQHAGFEEGTPETIREMVFKLHAQCPDGGYICAPSDQFFHGSAENIKAFADACKECTY